MSPPLNLHALHAGGALAGVAPGAPLGLRLLIDGSCVEAFTHAGQTLTTRAHRGQPPPRQAPQEKEASAGSSAACTEEVACDTHAVAACSAAHVPSDQLASSCAGAHEEALEAAQGRGSGTGLLHGGGVRLHARGASASPPVGASGEGGALPARAGGEGKCKGGTEGCGIVFMALGGGVVLEAVHVHAMGSAWVP